MQGIKKLLKEKEVIVGLTIQQVCQPWIAKVYSDAGADFIFLENEHLLYNGQDINNLVLTARLCGLPVVAKPGYVDRNSILKLLDAGITGIQLPMSESADQLRETVRFTKFPPMGERAACPGVGNTDYAPVDVPTWLKEMNEETTVIAHIESVKGLKNVDEILQVPGVDMMFIGMFDLSVSLDRPAQFDHPEVTAAATLLVEAAKKHKKIAGMWVPSYALAKPWISKGFRFFETASDQSFIANGAYTLMTQFPGHAPKIQSGSGHI